MAEALRSGKIGVMDYMNIQNITADTEMRGAIGDMTGKKENDGENKGGHPSGRTHLCHHCRFDLAVFQ